MSSLLPPNATPQERDLALTVSRISDIPVRVKEPWSPKDCPEESLPWLAWALHVDGWDTLWSIPQKRAAIAASVEVHRHKGTIGALKRALQAIGYEVYIDEKTGTPYTFRILVDCSEKGLIDQTVFDTAESITNENKNARSHLVGIRALLIAKGNTSVAAAQVSGESTTVWPEIIRLVSGQFGAWVAAVEQTIDTVRVFPPISRAQELSGAFYSSGVINIEMIYG
ncbi:MAG: phage tail protein I [Chthoniobacteraceae bacterium]